MSRFKVEISGLATNTLTVLSNQEMKELFQRYQSGEGDVKDLLIKGNLKLVLSLVQRFLYRVENMDDLFQVGCIGLVKAIDNFDLKHEVRFSTYAVPMIMGEMKRYLRDYQSIKIARNLKVIKQYNENLIMLTNEETARMKALALERVDYMKRAFNNSNVLGVLVKVGLTVDDEYKNENNSSEVNNQTNQVPVEVHESKIDFKDTWAS